MADAVLKIVIPGTVASVLGAILGYYVGLWGGKVFIDKCQRYLGFSWADVELFGKKMTKSGLAVSLFFMRALPIVPLSLVSIVSGVIKVPLRTFIIWTCLGSIPRCLVLALLGWQMGAGALGWAKGVNRFESVISLGIVAAVIGVILYLRKRARTGLA